MFSWPPFGGGNSQKEKMNKQERWVIEIMKQAFGPKYLEVLAVRAENGSLVPLEVQHTQSGTVRDYLTFSRISADKLGRIGAMGIGTFPPGKEPFDEFIVVTKISDLDWPNLHKMSGIDILKELAVMTLICLACDYAQQERLVSRELMLDRSYLIR